MVEPPTPPGLVRKCSLVRLNKPVLDLAVTAFNKQQVILPTLPPGEAAVVQEYSQVVNITKIEHNQRIV